MSNSVKDTIYKLLTVMDSETQIRKYLKRFSSDEGLKFAVIKVGGKILKEEMTNLVSSLSFLKQVGLTPIIVHGAGPQLTERLLQKNINTEFFDGQRVTSPEVLKAAREVFIEQNHNLTSQLKESGVDATSFYSGVFNCQLEHQDSLGLVGSIKSVEAEQLLKTVAKGRVPVVSPLGETLEGQIVNVNADAATFSLALSIEPYKIIFLTETGGVLDQSGSIIPNISIINNYQYLIKQSWVHSGMKLKLEQIKAILESLPSATSVSITKPELLAKELFTDKGSGTLVNMGEKALALKGWSEIDQSKLTDLIESSFSKKLEPGYYQSLPLHTAYITECYRAAIILSDANSLDINSSEISSSETSPSDISSHTSSLISSHTSPKIIGIPYLDKFVVSGSAKGEGLGRTLWDKVTWKHKKLFWRAGLSNPINKFYASVADGFIRAGEWKVYWLGLEGFDEINACVDFAIKQPRTVTEVC